MATGRAQVQTQAPLQGPALCLPVPAHLKGLTSRFDPLGAAFTQVPIETPDPVDPLVVNTVNYNYGASGAPAIVTECTVTEVNQNLSVSVVSTLGTSLNGAAF